MSDGTIPADIIDPVTERPAVAEVDATDDGRRIIIRGPRETCLIIDVRNLEAFQQALDVQGERARRRRG